MKRDRIFILFSMIVLILATLACTIFVGGPDYPEARIPVSTEAVNSLNQVVQVAQTAAAQQGVLTLAINESQLTSLMAARLESSDDPFLRDLQVYLRNNEIQIYGKAHQGNLEANVRIVLDVSASTEGKPAINVKSVDFGPLPAPEGVNSSITAIMNEAFTGILGPAAIGFRLETVSIADGTMTLSGRVK